MEPSEQSEKTKVAMVYQTNPFRDSGGGGIRYLQNLVGGMSEYDAEILFIGAGREAESQGRVQFVPVCGAGRSFPVFFLGLFIYCLRNTFTPNTVVHVHRLYFALPFLWFARKTKVICSLHGWTFWVFRKRFGKLAHGLLQPIVRATEAYVLRQVDYFVPVSQDTLNFMNRFHRRTLEQIADRVDVIPSMIDLSRFKPEVSDYLQARHGGGRDYVTFIGRLAPQKNVGLLLEAWRNIMSDEGSRPNTVLVLVGHGELEQEMKAKAEEMGLMDSVIFHGLEAGENIPKVLNASKGMILPAVFEASPTVVKESLACGVPVVTTNVGDVEELIVDGKNGKIVGAGVDALAEGIRWLLETPTKKADVLSVSKGELERHSVASVCAAYNRLYDQLSTSTER
jgi:glycosyltransferase involved in cell wall biosynthesis